MKSKDVAKKMKVKTWVDKMTPAMKSKHSKETLAKWRNDALSAKKNFKPSKNNASGDWSKIES